MYSTYCVFMFYVLCMHLYQGKFQVGVNLLGNKYFLILILILWWCHSNIYYVLSIREMIGVEIYELVQLGTDDRTTLFLLGQTWPWWRYVLYWVQYFRYNL